MQPWGNMFSPKEISFLTSYVKSLTGTKPATPKAQQGDFYVDKVAGAVSDSATLKKKDSVAVAKPDTAGIKK